MVITLTMISTAVRLVKFITGQKFRKKINFKHFNQEYKIV